MIWLILGVLIWADIHLYKRYLPALYDQVKAHLGARYRAVFSGFIVLSIVLMVVGFMQMDRSALYYPPDVLKPLAYILLFVSVVLLGLGKSKSTYRGLMRHPMLTGVILWGLSHLMMFGEWRAIILFGGMMLWAVTEIVMINRTSPEYKPSEAGTREGDIRLLVISTVLYVVFIAAHILLMRVL